MGLGNYFIQDSDKDNFFRIVFFWKIKPIYNLDMFIHSFTVQSLLHYFDHLFDVSFIQPNGCELLFISFSSKVDKQDFCITIMYFMIVCLIIIF